MGLAGFGEGTLELSGPARQAGGKPGAERWPGRSVRRGIMHRREPWTAISWKCRGGQDLHVVCSPNVP